jgi:hypothetical protein
MTALDELLPSWDVRTRHAVPLARPPEQALAAVRAVTPADAPLMRWLFRLRRLARSTSDAPVFEQLRTVGFQLAAQTEREVVLTLVGQPWRLRGGVRADVDFASFDESGYAKIALSVEADGTDLATETRVLLTDAAARRRFRAYWLVVGPFSGLVRRAWLRAAVERAS